MKFEIISSFFRHDPFYKRMCIQKWEKHSWIAIKWIEQPIISSWLSVYCMQQNRSKSLQVSPSDMNQITSTQCTNLGLTFPQKPTEQQIQQGISVLNVTLHTVVCPLLKNRIPVFTTDSNQRVCNEKLNSKRLQSVSFTSKLRINHPRASWDFSVNCFLRTKLFSPPFQIWRWGVGVDMDVLA